MKARHDDLVEALDGMFDDHHGELAGLLLDQVAFLDAKIAHLHFAGHRDGRRDTRSVGVNTDGTTGPGAGTSPDAPVLNAVARLAEIPGISEDLARSVIAGTGLNITRSLPPPTWCPGLACAPQPASPALVPGPAGRARATATCAAASARPPSALPGTNTFPGERYSRIARRRGQAKAQVAVARSILVIIWHLLADPATRYTDLGYGYYQARTDTDRKLRNHIRQIQAPGFDVTLTKAALNPPQSPAGQQSRLRRRCRTPSRGRGFSGQSALPHLRPTAATPPPAWRLPCRPV